MSRHNSRLATLRRSVAERCTGTLLRSVAHRAFLFSLFLSAGVGCQQKMATQPAPRPYETNELFPHKQSARPLEQGVVHRNQRLDDDPLMAWLTPEGKKAKVEVKIESLDKDGKPVPAGTVIPPTGAPLKADYFVKDFPFQPTLEDLERGQTLYNSNCALCHGAAGYGDGKIAERGFLRPPSYHTDPAGKLNDWSTYDQPSRVLNDRGEPIAKAGLPMGYSRGFYRWGEKVALKDVPVGYFVQVITWGYGGMASHATQIPDMADRWRVAAYIRALELSQAANVADLPEDVKKKLDEPKKTGTGEAHQ